MAPNWFNKINFDESKFGRDLTNQPLKEIINGLKNDLQNRFEVCSFESSRGPIIEEVLSEAESEVPQSPQPQSRLLQSRELEDELPGSPHLEDELSRSPQPEDGLPQSPEPDDEEPQSPEPEEEMPLSPEPEEEMRLSLEPEEEMPLSPEPEEEVPQSPEVEEELRQIPEVETDVPQSPEAEDEAPESPEPEDEVLENPELEDERSQSPELEDELPQCPEPEDELPESQKPEDDVVFSSESEDEAPPSPEPEDELAQSPEPVKELQDILEVEEDLPQIQEAEAELPESPAHLADNDLDHEPTTEKEPESHQIRRSGRNRYKPKNFSRGERIRYNIHGEIIGIEEGFPEKYDYYKKGPARPKTPQNCQKVVTAPLKEAKKGRYQFGVRQIGSIVQGVMVLGPGKVKPEARTSATATYSFFVAKGKIIFKVGKESLYMDETNCDWFNLPKGKKYSLKNCGPSVARIAYMVQE